MVGNNYLKQLAPLQSCFYQLFWLFPISKHMGEKWRCAHGCKRHVLLRHDPVHHVAYETGHGLVETGRNPLKPPLTTCPTCHIICAVMQKRAFRWPRFSLDRTRRGDLAQQIAAGLRTAIRTGYYRSGDILPPVRDLAEILQVSKGIAEQAIALIREEGLVSPRPAVGSVVCAKDRPLWKGQVLIVMPPGGIQHYMNVVCAEVHDALIEAGYLALTVTVPRIGNRKFDFALLDLMMRQQIDLVVQLHDQPEITKWLSSMRVPFVRLSVDAQGRRTRNCVGAVRKSSEAAITELAAHCRESGVKDVLFVVAWGRELAEELLRAACANLMVWKLDLPPAMPGPQVSQRALDAMSSRLEDGWRYPELVIFDDDYVASGAITALLYAGVRIPGDIRVATLSNRSSGSGLVFPIPLTRIEVDAISDGRIVATAVLDYLKNSTFPANLTIGPKYIVGETF